MTEEKKYPTVVSGALIRNTEGKVLLAKNVRWNSQYVVFGGKVEWGENLETAVTREVKEEAGIDIEQVEKIGFGEFVPHAVKGHYDGKHLIFLDFVGVYTGPDDEIKLNDEYEDGSQMWVTVEEALKMDLGGGTRGLLECYQQFMKSKEYLNDLKRVQADFENFKKRMASERLELSNRLTRAIVEDLVPVLDNFHSAISHVPEAEKGSAWVTGITYIEKQFEDVLGNYGVKPLPVKPGDQFDPTKHEAIGTEQKTENDNKESGEHVVEKVVQKGYMIGDKVIRAAKVIVK